MYKNVQVNHNNDATGTTTAATTSPFPSSFPSRTNQTRTSLPIPVTSALSSSASSSTPVAHRSTLPNSTIGVSKTADGSISLPVSYNPSNENMSLSQSSKVKSDVDQLDELVKDLLIEVNRPISTNTNNRINNNDNNKYSTSSSSYSYCRRSNNDNNELSSSKLPSSIRASSYAQASTLNNRKRSDFDANTVSGLIDGSSNGIQREEQRFKTTREERIRIKRGIGGASSGDTEIPISSSTTTTTKTTTNKPVKITPSRDQLSIDEQLIDSLLESVQNTLRKRSQQQQPPWTTNIPVYHQHPANNRRTYSSSAAYTDSVYRVCKSRIYIIITHSLVAF